MLLTQSVMNEGSRSIPQTFLTVWLFSSTALDVSFNGARLLRRCNGRSEAELAQQARSYKERVVPELNSAISVT